MLLRLLVAVSAMSTLSAASAQTVDFRSSDLPILLINTGEQEIPDEPKIPALMAVIDNGPGVRNHVSDSPNGYDGHIGIEVRGTSSQMFPKRQYGMETRDAGGENRNVSLLGMPAENDWVLSAPYSDKSLMRNVLLYDLAREAGQYASRRRFVEVVLNGEYQGLYVLLEKVKRDNNRVDLNNLKPDETTGDDLTGGYIIEISQPEGPGAGWSTGYPVTTATGESAYLYNTPDADDIVPEQKAYIQSKFEAFEEIMASDERDDPTTGYTSLVDLDSFVDFVIWQEISRNVDGYRRSTYIHKDKDSNDPRLYAGPVWDFNLAFGNAVFYDASVIEGFQVDFRFDNPFGSVALWWLQMFDTESFQTALRARWAELREGMLADAALTARIADIVEELAEAQARNFERWPVLGQYVWPNAYVGETYADEVAYLESFLLNRADWLDAQWLEAVSVENPAEVSAFAFSVPRPNPARHSATVTLRAEQPDAIRVDLIDRLGRRIATVFEGRVSPSAPRTVTVETASLPAGVYVLRAQGETAVATRRFTVAR